MKNTRYRRTHAVGIHMHETSMTHLWKQKADQRLPGGGLGEGRRMDWDESDGNGLDIHYRGDYIDVYICQNSSTSTL